MKVVAEFEKPTKCEDCPCFYQTEGVWRDECQLTHKEIKNWSIIDKSCPLKPKETEEICMKLEERIHTLEVYLEGAINFLILNGDVDNPIIKSVENILHITFNKNWR